VTSERDVVDRVRDLLAARPATLGDGRLLCIDGPAGSGKTTLAAAVAARTGASVVHTDDLLEGWEGLPGLAASLERLLRPLASGGAGAYRRWDWYADAWAETVTVPSAPLLIVEGVGSTSGTHADLITVSVWVEAPPPLRRARGLARDGVELAHHWARWEVEEQALFARERTRERADVRVGS